MDPYMYQYLTGDPLLNIASQQYPQNNWHTNVAITNTLPVTVTVTIPYYTVSKGPAPAITPIYYHAAVIPSNQSFNTSQLPTGGKACARAWLVHLTATGGVVAVPDIPWSEADVHHVSITKDWLCSPGDFGPIPMPTYATPQYEISPPPLYPVVPPKLSTIIIPPDSPRVMVGCGTLPGDKKEMVCREQYWQLQADSYCLAGGETRSVSLTSTQGLQSTSSDLTSASASVGTEASAGWGGFSASVSASLSVSSTSFQQVTVTGQTTTYISSELTNLGVDPVMYLRWQMTDVLTFCHRSTHKPMSSVILNGSPVVVTGPYKMMGRRA
jgi:hypothetical protein